MRQDIVYSPRNIILLVSIFVTVIWLLYSLGSFLHESKKIQEEIDGIVEQNQTIEQEILEKKRRLEYLKTPQRIDKEAKMQMGRKQPGEEVIVFIEEKLDIVSPTTSLMSKEPPKLLASIPEKWYWVFFRKRSASP